MLNFLSFRNSKRIEHPDQTLTSEQPHEVVFQRNIKLGNTRISLTAGTTAQLVVDSSGFMTLRADNPQSAGSSCLVVQLDIGTTTRHIGGNGDRSMLTRLLNDLRFQFVEFGIQDVMLDSFFF